MMNVDKLIFVMFAIVFSFQVNAESEKVDDTFWGVYTTEFAKVGCKVVGNSPVRNVAFYNGNKSPKAIAEFVAHEAERLQYFALKQGMNAIVGYRESLQLGDLGGVATFAGVGVKLDCPNE